MEEIKQAMQILRSPVKRPFLRKDTPKDYKDVTRLVSVCQEYPLPVSFLFIGR